MASTEQDDLRWCVTNLGPTGSGSVTRGAFTSGRRGGWLWGGWFSSEKNGPIGINRTRNDRFEFITPSCGAPMLDLSREEAQMLYCVLNDCLERIVEEI